MEAIYFYPEDKIYFGTLSRPSPFMIDGDCYLFTVSENAWRKWENHSRQSAWNNVSSDQVPNDIRLKLLLIKE